jgi:hypothetical protein
MSAAAAAALEKYRYKEVVHKQSLQREKRERKEAMENRDDRDDSYLDKDAHCRDYNEDRDDAQVEPDWSHNADHHQQQRFDRGPDCHARQEHREPDRHRQAREEAERLHLGAQWQVITRFSNGIDVNWTQHVIIDDTHPSIYQRSYHLYSNGHEVELYRQAMFHPPNAVFTARAIHQFNGVSRVLSDEPLCLPGFMKLPPDSWFENMNNALSLGCVPSPAVVASITLAHLATRGLKFNLYGGAWLVKLDLNAFRFMMWYNILMYGNQQNVIQCIQMFEAIDTAWSAIIQLHTKLLKEWWRGRTDPSSLPPTSIRDAVLNEIDRLAANVLMEGVTAREIVEQMEAGTVNLFWQDPFICETCADLSAPTLDCEHCDMKILNTTRLRDSRWASLYKVLKDESLVPDCMKGRVAPKLNAVKAPTWHALAGWSGLYRGKTVVQGRNGINRNIGLKIAAIDAWIVHFPDICG